MAAIDSPVRVIILLMIKNESRIIRRSIESTLKIADAVCVCDTGSTDSTVDTLNEFLPMLPIPAKLYQHMWTNFGKNRTMSFQAAQDFGKELGWPADRTYALAIDADMELVVEPFFSKQTDLQKGGYQIIQKAGTLHYANMRFLSLSHDWKCVGATHEYWDGPIGGCIADNKIWINDRNDGGCKSDKYERDLRLLTTELEEQPENVRTVFYLAQTYKCLGQHMNSIKYYKKRIAMGGWFEEVWYSHYAIVQMYLHLNMPEKAELWAQRGYKFNGYRAEALYQLVKHFRITGDQWKAMHYYFLAKKISKPSVALFLESEVYDHLLDYEYTILQYYVNPIRKDGLISSLRYMLSNATGMETNAQSVFSNIEFYVEPLSNKYKVISLEFPEDGKYKASSCSIVPYRDSLFMNVRYVNYETSREGIYTPRDPVGIVRTRNAFIANALTPESQTLQFIKDDIPDGLMSFPTNIMGLEDVRVFFNKTTGKLSYTAASKEYNNQNKYRIVMGDYDPITATLQNNIELQPPTDTPCEKNWLAFNHERHGQMFIYGWHPFAAGVLRKITDTVTGFSKTKLDITHTHQTPNYFQHVRGSANPIMINGDWWVLTHSVKYGTPRKYYHQIVMLDGDSLKPKRISLPFYFATHGIEYCLGMNADAPTNSLQFFYSTFDAEPARMDVPVSNFEFINMA